MKEYYIEAIKNAARTLCEEAENICVDIDKNKIKEISVYITIDSEDADMDIEKKYDTSPCVSRTSSVEHIYEQYLKR